MGSSVAPPAGSMIAYDGPSSFEERILKSPVIARVRLDSATSTVQSSGTYRTTARMKYISAPGVRLQSSGVPEG